ncbi:MAG: S8 family serine peptidase [Jatrophihabitantaceae bacterium]
MLRTSRRPRKGRATVTTLAAAALVTTVVTAVSATPAGARVAPHAAGTAAARALHATRHPSLLGNPKLVGFRHRGRQAVFVELTGSGAAAVSRATARRVGGTAHTRVVAARRAVLDRRAAVRAGVASIMTAARSVDRKASRLFEVSNAVPGFGVIADDTALAAIARRPDVVRISPIVRQHATNANAAALTGVLDSWQQTGRFGDGVTIGVIDTGLDYTHADFGGTGTVTAYRAARTKADNQFFDWHAALPALAQAKVVGGFYFVGNAYDPNPFDPTFDLIPTPDKNPLGCDPHGTHVAGTAAGYGEYADGSTFTGSYRSLDAGSLLDMKIGPGMAPMAKIFALKVFGCRGGTDAVIPALDAALDPNGDGNFSDHLDIVNLSLGGDYATPDDPENAVINQLALAGVLPVVAMGNGGDLTDIGGAPGTAVRALAAASSVDSYQLRDGLQVNTPTSFVAAGQNGSAYNYATRGDVLAKPVVAMPGRGNSDGCLPFTNAQRTAVRGKAVWLEWDDNDATRRCGSAARGATAAAAGAAGVVLPATLEPFGAGILGDPHIPMFQLTKAGTPTLRTALLNSTLNVSFQGSLANTVKSQTPSISDTLSTFSSRGTHGSIGVVKPDVAAPGDTIASAGLGTGTGVLVDSGTSMATPLTAGIAALVKQTHPTWSSEQLKAAVMNTADHDIWTGRNHTGHVYGPARDGAGRVDAYSAVTTSVLAYNAGGGGGVSASFGVVEAPVGGGVVTKTRTITVQNTSGAPQKVTASYAGAVSEPGVSYSVDPGPVSVPANATATLTVTMTVTPGALRHTIDPTMQTRQVGTPRQYVSDASGRLLITPTSGPRLRVPVYGAAKPVSVTTAAGGRNRISLGGRTFDQGPRNSTHWTSLSVPMGLDATSARLPACSGSRHRNCTINKTVTGGDIHYVGSDSFPGGTPSRPSLPDGYFYVGIATYGDNATIGNSTVPFVDIDVNHDGYPDFEAFVQSLPGTDVLLSNVVDLNTGEFVDEELVNWVDGSVDTNVFDSNTVIVPIRLGALGVRRTTKSFPVTYFVGEFSPYATDFTGTVDSVGPIRVDAARPKVGLGVTPGALPLYQGRGPITAKVARPTSALVFFLHNGDNRRTTVVRVTPDRSAMTIHAPASVGYGDAAPITGRLVDTVTHRPVRSAPVGLYAHRYGTQTYRLVATRTTDGRGVARASVRPQARITYQWRFAGGSGHGPAGSGLHTVQVRQAVTRHVKPRSPSAHQAFRLYGRNFPGVPGAAIDVQRLVAGRWRTVTVVRTRLQRLPGGVRAVGYSAALREPTPGGYWFRALWPAAGGRLGGHSNPILVRIS